MPELLSLESEAFHTLLTDALRAGPGSPEWHQAVLALRSAGQTAQGDELKLLMEARESLESGKEYRSVRPGPGFTRKVFDEIEKEKAGGKRGPSTGSSIMYLAGFVGIGLLILLLYVLFQGKGETHGVDELAGTLFTHQLVQSRFNDGNFTADWTPFGDTVAATHSGLSFKPAVVADARGGIVLSTNLASDTVYAINVDLHPYNSSSSEITTIFLRDTPVAGGSGADHELVFLVRDGVPQILLPDGRNVYQGPRLARNQGLGLSIKLGKDVVIIEADHNRLYAGPHQLNADQPRYFGIRFQTPGSNKPDAANVQGVLVQKQ